MMKGYSYEIRKPKNVRSIQNIEEPSKEVLGFKVCSKMFMNHHLPWEVISTKGALDTKDYHCEIKNSKRTNSKLGYSKQRSILKVQTQRQLYSSHKERT